MASGQKMGRCGRAGCGGVDILCAGDGVRARRRQGTLVVTAMLLWLTTTICFLTTKLPPKFLDARLRDLMGKNKGANNGKAFSLFFYRY